MNRRTFISTTSAAAITGSATLAFAKQEDDYIKVFIGVVPGESGSAISVVGRDSEGLSELTFSGGSTGVFEIADEAYSIGEFFHGLYGEWPLMAVDITRYDIPLHNLRGRLKYPNLWKWKRINADGSLRPSNRYAWISTMHDSAALKEHFGKIMETGQLAMTDQGREVTGKHWRAFVKNMAPRESLMAGELVDAAEFNLVRPPIYSRIMATALATWIAVKG